MTDTTNTIPTGTDGVQPIANPEGRWCWWALPELWMGTIGTKRYVPKVNDYVMDYDTYTTYRVTYIDPVTLIPTLVQINPANMSFTLSQDDVLFGVGPGTQSDTYRVYVDKSVNPYVLAVDARLKVGGSLTTKAKIFKGADLTEEGHVISKVYDSSGNFISENIPLELIAIDSHTNYSIKAVSVCHTTDDLVDGEVVTAVFYNDQGHVMSKRQLLVENTAFIRAINSSQKYVSHISVESAFLSPANDHVIEFPLNIPMNALNLVGVVNYSDGSHLRLPVDGNKFRMFGLEQYVSTIIGQTVDLVLTYALSPSEAAYAGVSSDGHFITEPYSLTTVNPNNSYAVKLMGYPVWIDVANGYEMRWFLLNLDRNILFDVTPYIHFSSTTGPFNPKGYGYLQRKSVNVNLRDVSGIFKSFVHVQLVDIVLNDIPDITDTPWTVMHESISTRPTYGAGLHAMKINDLTINVSSGITTFEAWKEEVYLRTFPLINPVFESAPPEPTHFVISYAGQNIEYEIQHWAEDLVVNINFPLYSTVFIRFIKRTSTADLTLGISAMIVKA